MTRRSFQCLLQASLILGLGRANSSIQRRVRSVNRATSNCERVPSPFEAKFSSTSFTSDSCPVMEEDLPHFKARSEEYPRSNTKRFPVPDNKVPWEVPFPEYRPVYYTSKSVLDKPPWADDEDVLNGRSTTTPAWNKLDTGVNRASYMGQYSMDPDTKVPRNPKGRTGISGRGCLGRWGPNHAADPIVTRWKVGADGKPVKDKEGKKLIEFIAVQRKDNKEWAIPGGMVDPEEVVTETMRREFGEEALNSMECPESEKKKISESVYTLFQGGAEVYRGYVDDPRNTDNAWMETVAMNFHDEDGSGVANFKLTAGDDAVHVQWQDVDKNMSLYASHKDFLRKVAQHLNASW